MLPSDRDAAAEGLFAEFFDLLDGGGAGAPCAAFPARDGHLVDADPFAERRGNLKP